MKAHKIARTIAPAVGASTLAGLESRTTSEASVAQRAPGLKTGSSVNFSGQYLYDRFVANDKTEITKLDIVRKMVDALDVEGFKKSINEMVAIAASLRDKAIEAAKESDTYDKDQPGGEISAYAARLKTAQNHKTVMCVSFGALKFCADDLESYGYDDNTGYQTMAVLARKALNAHGIKWDGTKQLSKGEQDRKAQSKAETKALEKIMAATPRGEDEPMAKYLARCGDKVGEQLAVDNAERERAQVHALVKKVREMSGGYLDEVIEMLLSNEAPPMDEKAAVAAAGAAVKH